MCGFPLVHAVLTSLIDYALSVAHDDVGMRHAHGFDKLGTGNRGGPCAVAYDFNVFETPSGQVARIDKASGGDNSGAVLVIMKYRNVHFLAQRLFDDEAFGCSDIF